MYLNVYFIKKVFYSNKILLFFLIKSIITIGEMFVIFENGLSIHWFMKGNVHKLYKSLKAAWNELSGLFKRLWVHGGLSELNISESTLHIFHQNRIFLIFAERCADLEHFLLLSCCCLCDIQRHACKFSRSVCDTFQQFVIVLNA